MTLHISGDMCIIEKKILIDRIVKNVHFGDEWNTEKV